MFPFSSLTFSSLLKVKSEVYKLNIIPLRNVWVLPIFSTIVHTFEMEMNLESLPLY